MAATAEFAETAVRAAAEAARQAGLAWSEPELLRLGERAVLTLSQGEVIARVERVADRRELAAREVAVARWLDQENIPVGRPLAGKQPWDAAGTVVTLWEAVHGEWTVPAELAALLARLHRLSPPAALGLPELDPFDRIDERITAARGLTCDEKAYLGQLCRELRDAAARVRPVRGRVVIHGDANIGNVLKTARGTVLFDLDGVCWGPAEWDLVLTALYRELGWHSDQEYRAFCDVYGFDVTTWEGYPVFKRIREVRMVTWLSQKAGESSDIDAEINRRLADLADPERPRRWHPY